MKRALLSSERQTWQTPDHVLEVVREVGPIHLDPCTTDENPTGAVFSIYPGLYGEGDGLDMPWWGTPRGRGLVYVNPPYGREVATWADKAIREGERGCRLILLTAARPGSRWCQRVMASAHALCFWRGRIRFRGAPNCAPFDSLFSSWNLPEFAPVFRPHGVVFEVAS